MGLPVVLSILRPSLHDDLETIRDNPARASGKREDIKWNRTMERGEGQGQETMAEAKREEWGEKEIKEERTEEEEKKDEKREEENDTENKENEEKKDDEMRKEKEKKDELIKQREKQEKREKETHLSPPDVARQGRHDGPLEEPKPRGQAAPEEDLAPPDGGWGWAVTVGAFIIMVSRRWGLGGQR